MSNTVTMDKLTMDDLEREEFDALQEYFEAHGCCEADGDSGTVTIHEVPVTYEYAAEAAQLTMTITTTSERVTPAKVRSLLGRLRELHQKRLMAGHYNHVDVTIKNESDQLVIYSEQTIDNGDLDIKDQRIGAGKKALAFKAQSSTLSGLGCQGRVVYTFADGNTQLTMDYKLNGNGIHSFNAGVKGTNAQRFEVSASNTGAHYDCGKAITEMKPTVTIKLAKP